MCTLKKQPNNFRLTIPGIAFEKEYVPLGVDNAEDTTPPVGDNNSTFTFDGPPSFRAQLSPPSFPTIRPDTVNLQKQ